MLSYRFATTNDIDEIMLVISDVKTDIQEKSKIIINNRVLQNQILCILEDDKIIGFIGWNKNYENNSKFLFIEQITIKSSYRHRGIGQKTIRYFLDMSKELGYKKIFSTVEPHNNISMNMFLKTGWKNSENASTNDDILLEYNLL
jgi:N-acetylglutamate synthase-like GNAT family acetyltransferase